MKVTHLAALFEGTVLAVQPLAAPRKSISRSSLNSIAPSFAFWLFKQL